MTNGALAVLGAIAFGLLVGGIIEAIGVIYEMAVEWWRGRHQPRRRA